MMGWKDFDPEWLAQLAEKQEPDEAWLPGAIRRCTKYYSKNETYYYFVKPSKPNQGGSEWQFERNIVLKDEVEGDIVLDILKGQRIGGIEFLSRL